MAKKVESKKALKKTEESSCDCFCKGWKKPSSGGCGGAYGIGLVGALFYYLPQATGVWSAIVLFLKSLVWPAFLVYEALKFLSA